jgi:MHS family shikimate/dehydroshikimate transporter-like MFS transporter
MDRQVPLTGMMIASAIGILMCPIIGWLSDRWGQRTMYLAGAGFLVLFSFPFFQLLGTKDTFCIWFAMIIAYNFGPTMMFAVQPTMFSRMFGTNVRYTGLSFAYQFSAVLGGLTPLLSSTFLALGEGKPWFVSGYLTFVAAISFICVCLIKSDAIKSEIA